MIRIFGFTAAVSLLCMLYLPSCSQRNSFIKKLYAYKTVRPVGRKPIDINGNETFRAADTVFLIYAETKSSNPVWEQALFNNQVFNISASPIVQNGVEVGTEKQTGKKVQITAAKGNRLWQIELSPTSENRKLPVQKENGKIMITGKYNNQSFKSETNKVIDIQLPDAG